MKAIKFKIFLAGATALILGACTNFHEVQGDRSYEALAYQEAIHHYEKVVKKTHKISTEVNLAESYFKVGNMDSAELKYAHTVKHNSVPAIV
ncbi:MAG: hypothetical protein ACOVO3_05345, partial [Fluviicola sp.]